MISIFLRRGASCAPGPGTSGVYALAVCVLLAVPGFAQDAEAHKAVVTPLSTLLEEAKQNNPQIQAARDGTQAARQVPAQVTALPDPTAQVQQVNVGSPRPFAGYSNDEFANVGLGISQDIPYPGKLKLRGEVAKRDADIAGNREDSATRAVLAQVKDTYFHLGYLSETLSILNNDRQLLKQMEQAAEARYRSGMGNQQDVLQAQLQQTKLLRDISAHHLEVGKMQVSLKQLLSRPQSSPDIEPVTLKETPLGVFLRRTSGRGPDAEPRPRRHPEHDRAPETSGRRRAQGFLPRLHRRLHVLPYRPGAVPRPISVHVRHQDPASPRQAALRADAGRDRAGPLP